MIPKYGFPPMVRTVQDLGDPQVDENSRIFEGLWWKTCIRESSAFDWTRCTEMRANTSVHREVLRPSSPKTRHATDQGSRSASDPVPSSVKFSGTSERAGSFKSWPSRSKLKTFHSGALKPAQTESQLCVCQLLHFRMLKSMRRLQQSITCSQGGVLCIFHAIQNLQFLTTVHFNLRHQIIR